MKLAQYISLRFIGIAAIIMLLSIPVFYFVIEKIMQDNVDESLKFQKVWLISQMQKETPENFGKFNQNVAIKEVNEILRTEDNFNTKNVYVENDDEFVTHRILDFYEKINGKNYHFKIQKSLVENEDILKNIALLQLMLFLVLIGMLLLINRNVQKKVWNPFYQMLDSLKKYRIDRHNFEIQKPSPVSEMNDLNASLADLTERNRKLYSAQKEFTENASHELQTPLAVIQNKLEMLMQTEPLNEQQINYISDLYSANQKISKLNKSLLLLAKIDNHQFDQLQNVSLNLLLKKNSEDFQFIFEEKEINFSTDFQNEKMVNANETLMQILLNNLISNAVKYTPKKGFVNLKITEQNLEITNLAEQGKLDENRLFKRFQKQNSKNDSNGIGLEICKKICELYGWKLNYSFQENAHAFTINFY